MHWLGASACARSHSLPLPALALATFVRLRRLSDRRLHADFAEFGSPAQYSPAVTLRLLASIRYFRTFGERDPTGLPCLDKRLPSAENV